MTPYTQKAIERATEGGYRDFDFVSYRNGNVRLRSSEKGGGYIKWDYRESELLLDASFWRCLGKAEGWGERYCTSGCGCTHNGGGEHEYDCVWEGENEWLDNWHRFIDHLSSGGSIEGYFKSIISKK